MANYCRVVHGKPSAHPFPRLHACSFSRAVEVCVCVWGGGGGGAEFYYPIIPHYDEKRLRENVFLCTEANSGCPSRVKFGDNTDCKIAWKCVDTERDLSTPWVYLNSKTAQSTHKGVNWRSKDVTQIQQQRPESPTITLTWHACKYKVCKLHQRHILKNGCPLVAYIIPYISGTLGHTGVHRHKTEPIFIQDRT